MAAGLPPSGGMPTMFDLSSFPSLPSKITTTNPSEPAPNKTTYADTICSKPFIKVDSLPKLPHIDISPPTVTTREGLKAIIFQEEELERSKEAFKFALVARFYGERPSIDQFDHHVNSEWGLESLAVVGLLSPRLIMIRMENEVDFRKARVKEDCQFNHVRYHLSKWTDNLQETKRAIWIELQKLPVYFQPAPFLEQIGNSIGSFLEIDERTKAGKHPIAPRLCVEVDISKPLPRFVWVGYSTKDGRHLGVQQEITYDFSRSRCVCCKHFGHEAFLCPDKEDTSKVSLKLSSWSRYNLTNIIPPKPLKKAWVPKGAKPVTLLDKREHVEVFSANKTPTTLCQAKNKDSGDTRHQVKLTPYPTSPPCIQSIGDHLSSNELATDDNTPAITLNGAFLAPTTEETMAPVKIKTIEHPTFNCFDPIAKSSDVEPNVIMGGTTNKAQDQDSSQGSMAILATTPHIALDVPTSIHGHIIYSLDKDKSIQCHILHVPICNTPSLLPQNQYGQRAILAPNPFNIQMEPPFNGKHTILAPKPCLPLHGQRTNSAPMNRHAHDKNNVTLKAPQPAFGLFIEQELLDTILNESISILVPSYGGNLIPHDQAIVPSIPKSEVIFVEPLQAIPTEASNVTSKYDDEGFELVKSRRHARKQRVVTLQLNKGATPKKIRKSVSWSETSSVHFFERDIEENIEELIPRGKPTIKTFKNSKAYRMEGAKHVAWASKYFRDHINYIDEMDQRQLEYWEHYV